MGTASTYGHLWWLIAITRVQFFPCSQSKTSPILQQFHIVFDDNFTTVEYLCKMTVPPHWAGIVCYSTEIQVYSEHEASTWPSLPNIDKEVGIFLYKQTTPSTSTLACEEVEIGIVHNEQYNQVSFLEEHI
jgi:hypothetical protein